ncbi:MBL fold metallo-hydrolase [Cohnella sp. AR92]|uniref:MBL fold metallo-hydrolase n=1 Tax=Cohnella sp. AR92 TaxID=648716 RepID=UPI000F8E2EF0|nr:MBL fold metallo-hydrolase [Cohnella sp. AR92]RUS44566.1 MBL fold metallo-hydrolase [Cohnella sp. AR92]
MNQACNVKVDLIERFARFSLIFLSIFIFALAGCTTAPQDIKSSTGASIENRTPSSPDEQNVQSKEGSSKSDTSTIDTKVDVKPVVPENKQPEGELKVHFIDVGQGASQLIIGPTGKTMLIDAGDNNMEKTVVGYLQYQKISKIDILIGTHPDADHIGGLDKVIDNFDIGKIYMPKVQSNTKTFESVLLSIQNKNLKVTTAKAGLTLDWEPGIDVKMIAPGKTYNDDNDMSAVVHLTFGQTSFLFTGDAEVKSEQDMISSGVDLKSDVLLVGHHGSKSSTSQKFLDKVNPTYAVIQVGKGNNYGHPTQEILKRLNDKGVKVYRNDEQGNIIFTSNGNDITVSNNPSKYSADVNNGQSPPNEDVAPAVSQSNKDDLGTLSISANIDNKAPAQNATVTVTIKVIDGKGNPVSNANVTLKLHYKSTVTTYEGKTNSDGVSTLPFKIGRASKGFTVDGDITVTFGGKSSNAKVSFTPQ